MAKSWNTTESIQTSNEGGLTLRGSGRARVTGAKFKVAYRRCTSPLDRIISISVSGSANEITTVERLLASGCKKD